MRTASIPVRAASVEICAAECGGQCCRAPGRFTLQHHELVRLNEANKTVGAEFRHIYQDPTDPNWYMVDFAENGGACPFLDRETNLCRVYEDRPQACREYPLKREACCRLWEPG